MKTYKAIGFDWGGVLNGKPGKYFAQTVADTVGVTREEYQTAYFHHNQKVNRGEVSWQQLWELVLDELGHQNEPELVRKIIKISEEANADNLNDDMLKLVHTLRSNGYKVGLLSNNSADKAALMRERGLDKRFDVLDISVETGFVKPNSEAFIHLADGLGVDISELIYVDDTPKSLSTAENVGFTPILFDNYNQLVKDLTALGIHIVT
jgi:putative hydrolase of the HAD superfamily